MNSLDRQVLQKSSDNVLLCAEKLIAYFYFYETRPAAPEELTHLALTRFLLLATLLRFLAWFCPLSAEWRNCTNVEGITSLQLHKCWLQHHLFHGYFPIRIFVSYTFSTEVDFSVLCYCRNMQTNSLASVEGDPHQYLPLCLTHKWKKTQWLLK